MAPRGSVRILMYSVTKPEISDFILWKSFSSVSDTIRCVYHFDFSYLLPSQSDFFLMAELPRHTRQISSNKAALCEFNWIPMALTLLFSWETFPLVDIIPVPYL